MDFVVRGAFDQAVALGHHRCGEEHMFLALVSREPVVRLSPNEAAAAVVAQVERDGPEVPEDGYEGCGSAPSYHVIATT